MLRRSIIVLFLAICVTMVLSNPGFGSAPSVDTKSKVASGYGGGNDVHEVDDIKRDGRFNSEGIGRYGTEYSQAEPGPHGATRREHESRDHYQSNIGHGSGRHAPGEYDNDNHRRGGNDYDRRGYGSERHAPGAYDNDDHTRGGHDNERRHGPGEYDNDNHRRQEHRDSERHRQSHETSEEGHRRGHSSGITPGSSHVAGGGYGSPKRGY